MLVSEIIELAFQESGVKGLGVQPTDIEQLYALSRLNSIIKMLFGNKISTNVMDWTLDSLRTAPVSVENQALPYPSSGRTTTQANHAEKPISNVSRYIVPVNSRLLCSIEAETKIWLPEAPHDGAKFGFVPIKQNADLHINANGRLIEGFNEIFVPYDGDNSHRTWFYRADLGNWIIIKDVVLTDESPLPTDFDDLLVCALAIRMSAVNGMDPRAGTMQQYTELLKMLENRYISTQSVARNGDDIYNNAVPTRYGFMET